MDSRAEERSIRKIQLKKAFDNEAFFTFIDARIKQKISPIEAIIDYCERNDIDVQLAADVLKRNPKYKKMLHEEASSLKMLK